MSDYEFLAKILQSKDEYWIVAIENTLIGGKQLKDDIVLIAIPNEIKRVKEYGEILLKDINTLKSINVPNIYLNNTFAPFQYGVTLYNAYRGYSFSGKVSVIDFLKQALVLESDNIADYAQIINEITESK